jgi:ATP-dependent DNA helicase RecQ
MAGESKHNVRLWIEQLVGQDCLQRDGEFKTLSVTPKGWKVIRGAEKPKLSLPAEGPVKAAPTATESWQGVDEGLFEQLRILRKQIADKKEVPAFVIFSDATLRDMARRRPSAPKGFLKVTGVGLTKNAEYGARFLETITAYCRRMSIPTDVEPLPGIHSPQARPALMPPASLSQTRATQMFRDGLPVETVAHKLGRAESTTYGYLEEYIIRERITSIETWVDYGLYNRIVDLVAKCGTDRLKPIFDDLGGTVSYGLIRITLACLRNQAYVNASKEVSSTDPR